MKPRRYYILTTFNIQLSTTDKTLSPANKNNVLIFELLYVLSLF
jgi:hypothetical protein